MPKFKFPDPDDRSANDPTIIADSERVLSLYNQEHDTDRERVTDTIKEWFIEESTGLGWDSAVFHGSGCVLAVELQKKNTTA